LAIVSSWRLAPGRGLTAKKYGSDSSFKEPFIKNSFFLSVLPFTMISKVLRSEGSTETETPSGQSMTDSKLGNARALKEVVRKKVIKENFKNKENIIISLRVVVRCRVIRESFALVTKGMNFFIFSLE
jgi:hypothetical protein